jgi:2,4-dienoyl-CoA reductase-like NADH-dependent reductase (Old Yellow Enzyme family)
MTLFKESKIGNLNLRNKFVMAPMTTWSGNTDGTLSREEIDYYEHRSRGVGMVITATTYTMPNGQGFTGQFYAGDGSSVESLKRLSDVIHKGGAKAILQVFHAGRKGDPATLPGGTTLSASAVAGKREDNNIPRAMLDEEIENFIESFYKVTIRAHQAGFDGIEIHGANTYLLQQFFSPHSNIRTDKWGGDLTKRVTLPLRIIDACLKAKNTISDPFIIGYRFSPEENSDPGITLEDTDYLIDRLCDTEIDYLHISLGDYKDTSIRDESNTASTLNRVANRINHRKPFIGVGSIYSLEDANKCVALGADYVALGRQLLIDADCVQKWERGQSSIQEYDASRQVEDKMPKILHDIIVNREGWVPIKK